MNYTTNYHLPQWVETDRIMMEDFNQMCAAIDQGIKGAQDTAETAQANASAAQTAADAVAGAYTPDNKPFVVGTYQGDTNVMTISLGFRPSAVLIGQKYDSNTPEDTAGTCALFSGSGVSGILLFSDDGFTVLRNSPSIYPAVNWNNKTYWYIAFR